MMLIRRYGWMFILFAVAASAGAAEVFSEAGVEALKTEGKALRKQAEETFQQERQECYRKFLVNRCIDQAKQRRLATINQARVLEREARTLELAEKQRAAAAALQAGAARPEPAAIPDVPSPSESPRPSVRPGLTDEERARLQAEREQTDAERARRREKAEEDAALRAEKARSDRERYDQRIREYEEKQRARTAPAEN